MGRGDWDRGLNAGLLGVWTPREFTGHGCPCAHTHIPRTHTATQIICAQPDPADTDTHTYTVYTPKHTYMHTLLCSTHTDTHAYTHTPVHTLTYRYTHKCRPSIYIDTHMHTQTHTHPQLPQLPSLLDQAGVNLDLKSRRDFVYLSRLPPSPFLSQMVSKTLGHPQDLASFPSLTFPLLQNGMPMF